MFDTFVTSPEGRTFKTLNSPYRVRDAVRRIVRMTLGESAPPSEEGWVFIDRVVDAPLGETVTHAATGISFRTEAAS